MRPISEITSFIIHQYAPTCSLMSIQSSSNGSVAVGAFVDAFVAAVDVTVVVTDVASVVDAAVIVVDTVIVVAAVVVVVADVIVV